MEEENNKPNGFQWFTLGFSICTLIFNTIILIAERKWKEMDKLDKCYIYHIITLAKLKLRLKECKRCLR